LPASTLNSIFAKKNEIREQIQKCGNACKKGKTGNESIFAELENIPDRLTVLLCVKSDGSDEQVPIVIGKSSKPRCFEEVKKLPIKCHANSKAWMTTEIFCSFLHSLEKVEAFFYAHSVTDADRENILSLEVIFSIEAKFCQEVKDNV
jgi:hypothetical protein